MVFRLYSPMVSFGPAAAIAKKYTLPGAKRSILSEVPPILSFSYKTLFSVSSYKAKEYRCKKEVSKVGLKQVFANFF